MSSTNFNSPSRDIPSYARLQPAAAHYYAELSEQGVWDLDVIEKDWRDQQPFLASRGYLLRPRYHPTWKPSWVGTNLDPHFCEDGIAQRTPQLLDARRLDGTLVALKRTRNTTTEINIARFLSSILDAKNHSVTVLDYFPDPSETTMSFIVMPLLRPYNDPPFAALAEVLDFVGQTLEGLSFMHSRRVAHLDCAGPNIMMDARPLFPQGWHPVRRRCAPDGVYDLPPVSRLDTPVRYYFIDFGNSTCFLPEEPPYVVGVQGRDRSVPELSWEIPYDAFKVDVYAMGHMYQEDLLETYYGLAPLIPLLRRMTDHDPDRRPTAEDALNDFKDIFSGFDPSSIRSRIRRRDESVPERILNNIRHFMGHSL
ncbi:hypothetical protein JAAARDRAFT_52110 [Jaapia argillacea MUCL 33604]|uniref:Protein kinase domain-containing protein n=1 Tax=Jaapia argillacea MUCL 33604 TaxID=933084 RepID=A0A067QNA6_9AGAM|nr:hypothetical protein JAAARDRAFT_52110 [Jaapia argillacea MUCL 33604]